MKNYSSLVSLAIPTFNSGKTLETTLLSIKKQTYPNIEVIVADGGSIDNTLSIAKKYNAKICFAKELGRARYEAFKKSKGVFIFALDSDQFIDENTVKKCVDLMVEKKYDALILSEKSVIRKGTLVEKILSYDKLVVNSAKDLDPVFGASIPRFFLRKTLLGLNWPKTLSILDDAVLIKEFIQKNNQIGFAQEIYIRHYEVDSFTVLFKKFIRHGKLYIPTMRVSAGTIIAHSLPRRAYLTRRVFSKPNILFGLSILYAIKSVAVLTGIMIYLFQETFKYKAK